MTGTQDISNSLQEAIVALQSGIPGQARAILESLIEQGVDNAAVWGVLALASRDQGDMKNAIAAADRSLAHEPRNPRAIVVKGDAYFKAGDRQAAAAFYRDALNYIPTQAQLAPDMAADVQRARERMESLAGDFTRHLNDTVGDLIDNAKGDTARMQQAVDMLLGTRRIYYPEPKQIHFPGLSLQEFAETAHFDWVPAVEAAFEDILSEAQALQREHTEFDAYLKSSGSRPAYDLHGLKDNQDWGAFYLWYNGEPITENQARCPKP
ncbi:MAG TPA: hypothetical protein DIC58_01745, partial [Gammaproteobacteria bacterium]|nr:hypothetical protein [Gammaproteobacteria bacterium]